MVFEITVMIYLKLTKNLNAFWEIYFGNAPEEFYLISEELKKFFRCPHAFALWQQLRINKTMRSTFKYKFQYQRQDDEFCK